MEVRYLTFDMVSNAFLAELPLTGVSYSNFLDAAGPLQATLNIDDPTLDSIDPIAATAEGRTILLVCAGSTVEWAGTIDATEYDDQTRAISITGTELENLLGELDQYRNHSGNFPGFANSQSGTTSGSVLTMDSAASNLWTTNPVPPVIAACKVVGEAWKAQYTALSILPITVGSSSYLKAPVRARMNGGYPPARYWHQVDLPLSAKGPLSQILSNLAGMDAMSGFDWTFTASLSGITPSFNIDLWWPRLGFDSTGGTSTPGTVNTGIAVIETADLITYKYPKDATQMASRMDISSSGIKGYRHGIGDFSLGSTWDGSGYFFQEKVAIGTGIVVTSSSSGTQYAGVVTHITDLGPTFGFRWKIAWAAGAPAWAGTPMLDIAALIAGGPTEAGYPPRMKALTNSNAKSKSMLQHLSFAELAKRQWPASTPTITVDAFGQAGISRINVGDDVRWRMEPCKRFPSGLDTYWRVVQGDVTVGDSGSSQVTWTLDVPPNIDAPNGGFPGFQPPA